MRYQKAAEENSDLIDKTTKVSKDLPQNNTETVTN